MVTVHGPSLRGPAGIRTGLRMAGFFAWNGPFGCDGFRKSISRKAKLLSNIIDMAQRRASLSPLPICLLLSTLMFLPACGGGNGGGGGGGNPPSAPTGLAATAGNAQVSLTWNAAATATSYNVKRSTTSGGSYTTISSPGTTSYTDTSVTNGTTYYYVVSAVNGYGESGNSSQASATPVAPPPVPTGLTATAGNQQVALGWSASTGATSYNVKRSTTNGGPYTQLANPATTNYTDSGLTNGTTYYYVVSALNGSVESGNSAQASATPGASTSVAVTINVLANRHTISPYIYGGAFPANTTAISDTGTTVVRWGGNAASTYNWQLFTDNADNDYYFEDFSFGALGNSADSDSKQFIKDVKAAGSVPLMTMVMLPWVAQTAETAGTSGNGHWSFPQTEYPNQCSFDQYNSDAGNGIVAGTCNNNPPTYITATTADLERTYFPILDSHAQACPPSYAPASTTCVYRSDWAAALATAFGSGTCAIPYVQITSCHFYDMDNEIDIWGGTHRDVHPNPDSFQELRDIFVSESASLKGWDPAAVRLGPVSCCWYFYWRSQTGGSDTSSHGGVDFLPWWLNEVAWSDQVSGTRTLDMFDIHAYPDADTNGLSTTQLKAMAAKIYRDWWDPTFNSAASYIVSGGFSIEPLDGKPFRVPRMRALVNQIYPGTAFSITEWSAAFAGEGDFSTAIGDADAYGVMGRERVSLSTRWTAPQSANPNYQSLKLFTNYDGSHHGFAPISVEATHNASPDLFSIYSAVNSAGTQMTILVLNKDPVNAAQVTFTNPGFTPTNFTTYTLSQSSPTTIVAGSSQAWSATQTFAPYTATLLVVTGTTATNPGTAWDLNPDTIMVPANGSVTLHPTITSGTSTVNLATAVFDAFEGASACTGGSINIGTATVVPGTNGAITLNAGGSPAFCHFTVTGTDTAGVTQTQGGWVVVGNPAATFTQTGNNQTGGVGTQLTLSVTVNVGQSRGTNTGNSVLFSTNAGTLSNGTTSGPKVIVVTDNSGSGVAQVTLTLPSTAQTVTVTAEGQYGLGHPVATFTETAN